MLDAANRLGCVLPLSEAHAALLDGAIAAGDGDLDSAAIVEVLRRRRTAPAKDPGRRHHAALLPYRAS